MFAGAGDRHAVEQFEKIKVQCTNDRGGGSVVAFACFLTVQERLGPGRAGTVGVMTPLLALVVSMSFERFQPDALTFVGAALAVFGNVLMLRRT